MKFGLYISAGMWLSLLKMIGYLDWPTIVVVSPWIIAVFAEFLDRISAYNDLVTA